MARADGVYDGSDMQCSPGHALGGVEISGPDGANDAFPGPEICSPPKQGFLAFPDFLVIPVPQFLSRDDASAITSSLNVFNSLVIIIKRAKNNRKLLNHATHPKSLLNLSSTCRTLDANMIGLENFASEPTDLIQTIGKNHALKN